MQEKNDCFIMKDRPLSCSVPNSDDFSPLMRDGIDSDLCLCLCIIKRENGQISSWVLESSDAGTSITIGKVELFVSKSFIASALQ